MKSKIIISTCMLVFVLYCGAAKAQQTTLRADQNPRYMESQAKYIWLADTLNSLHGTTVQDTYKAYDWYEAKMERRNQNREWRHEEYFNGYYNATPSWGFYSNYNYPFASYGYGNRWGHGGNWGGRARIGVGFGW